MMPLVFSDVGEEQVIHCVKGGCQCRQHLEELGFVPGAAVVVVADRHGDVIVNIKGSRIALGRGMASKVMVKNRTDCPA